MPTLGRDGLPRMASGDGSEAIKDGKEGEFDAKIDNYTQMKAGITTGMVEELNVLAKEVIEEKEHHDPQWDRERKRKLKNAVRRLKSSMSRQQVCGIPTGCLMYVSVCSSSVVRTFVLAGSLLKPCRVDHHF